ncbi:hypothetical protein BDV93DRAFT_567254 [Ceratobasidium sp. AG-I]|nr:hypothetical protein BDV93DRAFT_567254 [Ceratobasidium sp. AG-I]
MHPRQSVMHSAGFGVPPPRPDALAIFDSTHQANAQAILESYYHTVFALIRGGARRSALPYELVLYIIQYAELDSPYPSKSLSDLLARSSLSWKRTFFLGPSPRVRLLETPPLTTDDLRDINRIEVALNFYRNVESKRANLWNRILIGISPKVEIFKGRGTSTLSKTVDWPCFEPVPSKSSDLGRPVASFEPRRQNVIRYDHGIWKHTKQGDSIEVLMAGEPHRFPSGDCEAVMRVFKKWEPSPDMLRLLYTPRTNVSMWPNRQVLIA